MDYSHIAHSAVTRIFNERDEATRRLAMDDLFSTSAVFEDSLGMFVGHIAISDAVSRLLRIYPEYEFVADRSPESLTSVVCMHWELGVPGFKPAFHGKDFIRIENGKIAEIYRFLVGPAI